MTLSRRALNVLSVLQVTAISELARFTEGEIRCVKGCGDTTFRELRAALHSIALDFRPDPARPPSGDVPEYPPEQEFEHVADMQESCGTAGFCVWRLAVPGGWLYITQVSRRSGCGEHGTDCTEVLSAIPTFVRDG